MITHENGSWATLAAGVRSELSHLNTRASNLTSANDQTVQAIVFGVLATVIALGSLLVGYLQLQNRLRQRHLESGETTGEETFELDDTGCDIVKRTTPFRFQADDRCRPPPHPENEFEGS